MLIDRTGQIWVYSFVSNTLRQMTYYLIVCSDLDLKQHHVIAFYDTELDGSDSRDNRVYESCGPWEEWDDMHRIA